VRFFLSGIFALLTCLSLHAEEAVNGAIYYGNAAVVGKEYVFDETASTKKDSILPKKNERTEIASPDSSCIYIAPNAEVYGRELLVVKQNASSKDEKKAVKVKKEAPAPAENEITEQEPISSVLPVFPFTPSSSSFLQGGRELIAVSQEKFGGNQQISKACRGNAYTDNRNSDLSIYCPKQRQKLSIAATQCGELTSFGAQSPPALVVLS